MRRSLLSLGCMVAIVATGCVTSLNSLYTDEVPTSSDRIEGVWRLDRDKGVSLTIAAADHAYSVTLDSLSRSEEFEARLVELGKYRFLDLYRADSWEPHLVPVHNILRIQVVRDQMHLAALDKIKVETAVAADGITNFYTTTNDNRRLVLTASTTVLRQFFEKHAETIFSKPQLYRRDEGTVVREKGTQFKSGERW